MHLWSEPLHFSTVALFQKWYILQYLCLLLLSASICVEWIQHAAKINGGVQSSIVNVFMHACTGKGVEGWESPWDDQHLPGYWWTANTLLQWWGGWSFAGEREGPLSGSIVCVCMCVCMRVMQSNYIEYRICFMHYATAHKNTHTYGSDPN